MLKLILIVASLLFVIYLIRIYGKHADRKRELKLSCNSSANFQGYPSHVVESFKSKLISLGYTPSNSYVNTIRGYTFNPQCNLFRFKAISSEEASYLLKLELQLKRDVSKESTTSTKQYTI